MVKSNLNSCDNVDIEIIIYFFFTSIWLTSSGQCYQLQHRDNIGLNVLDMFMRVSWGS